MDNTLANDWVRPSTSPMLSVTSVVYQHLNGMNTTNQQWKGWHHFWKLRVAPMVKMFMWEAVHGKLPMGDYLYDRNIRLALCVLFAV